MPLPILILLFGSAVLHAGWNLLLKGAPNKYLTVCWAVVVSAVGGLPFLFIYPLDWGAAWPFLCISALLEAAYYTLMATAYQQGDFSLVYPIARGAAPALLAAWAVLFLHEQILPAGGIGVAVIVLGLATIGGSAWPGGRSQPVETASLKTALLAAVCISCYSAVDGAAVQRVHPASYTAMVFAGTAILLAPLTVRRYGLAVVLQAGRAEWRRMAPIGLFSLLAYTLVLAAYSLGKVSYAGAVREVSIVLAALAGWLWLKEKLGPLRVLGACLVFAGIFVIAWRG